MSGMDLANSIYASIRNEQVRIEELRYTVQAKSNLLKYKRMQLAELEKENVSKDEEFYGLRSNYALSTERRHALDRLIREEKDKQYASLMKLHSTDEQINKETELSIQEMRLLCSEWMNVNKKKFEMGRP